MNPEPRWEPNFSWVLSVYSRELSTENSNSSTKGCVCYVLSIALCSSEGKQGFGEKHFSPLAFFPVCLVWGTVQWRDYISWTEENQAWPFSHTKAKITTYRLLSKYHTLFCLSTYFPNRMSRQRDKIFILLFIKTILFKNKLVINSTAYLRSNENHGDIHLMKKNIFFKISWPF